MAIPSGVILPWLGTHAGIPANFTRHTNLDDRYPLGAPAATNPNTTGGASTHTHATSHTHTVSSHQHTGRTSGAASAAGVVQGLSGTAIATSAHTHAFPTTGNQTSTLNDNGTDVTTSGSSLPSSYGVIWIESNGSPAGVPNGGWVLWATTSAPASWTGEAGPAGKYLVGSAGAADAGASSGSATHSHSGVAHTHAIANHAHTIGDTDGPSATANRDASPAVTAHGSSTHTHTSSISSTASSASGSQTSGATGSTDVAPAYYKLGVIANGTGGTVMLHGMIGLWVGTLASIPANWFLCDGTNGTPDLRDRMIVGSLANLSDVGGTGGATSHDHTDPTSHTHSAAHTHTINTSGQPSATTNMDGGGSEASTNTHTHSGGASGSAGGTSGAGTEAVANATAYPPYRTVAYIQYQVTTATRTITPVKANVLQANTRTISSAKANVLQTNTRTILSVQANVTETLRVIENVAANLLQANTRTINPAKANVLQTNTRTIGTVRANILQTYTRTITPVAVGIVADPTLTPAPSVATAQQIEDALSGRTGPVDFRFRYSRRTRANVFIDDVDGVISPGAIELDNGRPVVRSLDVVFDRALMPDDFDPATDIIGVAVEVYVREIDLWTSIQVGLFVLDVSESRWRGDNETIPARGADMASFLVQSIRTSAYSVLQGENYADAIEAILARHGLNYSIPDTNHTVPLDLTWPAGTSDYEIARDLCFGINYYAPWADATGTIRTRERIDPSTEDISATYRDTAEPKMISALDDYVTGIDRKPINRVLLVIDDPRHANFGSVARENADSTAPNSTTALGYGTESTISTSSANNPTIITTAAAHGFSDGVQVVISGHSGATPDLNGSHIVTVLSTTSFSIPVSVSVGGTGGTVRATTVQQLELKGDSDPSTKAVVDSTVGGEAAAFELRWAAAHAQRATLPTFLDPRREAHEFYELDIDGIEDEQRYAVFGWRMDLSPGAIMQHSIGRALALTIESPALA